MSIDLNRTYGFDEDDNELSLNGSNGMFPNASSPNDSDNSLNNEASDCNFDDDDDIAEDVNLDDDDTVEDVNLDDNQTTEDGNFEKQNKCDVSMDRSEDRELGDVCLESLKNEAEKKLDIGSVIQCLGDVHKLYCDYTRLVGFSVKKGSQFYFRNTLIVKVKMYQCSCEGYPDNRRSFGRIASYKKQTYCTNCKARLRVRRNSRNGPWKVSVFFKEHNHELVDPSESYLLRSSRNMSEAKKAFLLGMKDSGIGVSRAYRFVQNEAGSVENIGFLPKDAYNELERDKRMVCNVANADANKLLDYFTEKGLTDPSFYWKVKLEDGRLKNLLFRDSRCLIDYQHFGDVISVDATYKTNKYDLICVPIVGINHHRTNVMFAIAFLTNEQTESYEWLFRTFLEAMYEKEPCVIFSYQDQALMNGVDYTFREASHRLCQWHVNKNALKHFGKLRSNKNFKSLWFRCMNGCESVEQFECCWRSMILEHDLTDNKWFSNMYNHRKRWSSAFTRHKFFAGLRATSRSEVTNKVLKDLCSSTSTMHEFVIGFERLQKSWRRREFGEDTHCRGMPGMFVQHSGILLQVAKLCTRNVFKSFQYEALNTISVNLTEVPPDMNDEILEFKVTSTTSILGFRIVKYNQRSKIASCSCHMWETEGVLCRHVFKVYFHLNCDRIPEALILTRWRRDSKERISVTEGPLVSSGMSKFSNMVFVNHNTKLVYDMLCECKDDPICRDAINDNIRSMLEAVKALRIGTKSNPNLFGADKGFDEILHRRVRNPKPKKKRPYRQQKTKRNWEDDGLKLPNERKKRNHVQDEPLRGIYWGSQQVNRGSLYDTMYRMSAE